jgi:colanic acid/amylovoran biosynthesis glycosyltransferase
LRVVLVTWVFPEPTETFISAKFAGLVGRGLDVHVVSAETVESEWERNSNLAARSGLRSRVHVGTPLEARVRALRPDLLHFEFGALARGRIGVKHELGCAATVSFRGFDIAYHALDVPGAYDEVWRDADAIHVLGEDLWRRALARGCPPNKPHALIPPAVDVEFFRPPGDRPANARPLRVLSVGRLEWKKGYDYGLLAVRRVVDAGIEVEYRIAGEGSAEDELRYAIDDLGLRDNVQLLGSLTREEVRDELGGADVLLHPSVSEGFGNAVLEAQAMEVPVVAADAEGLAENVEDGRTGYVVPRRDPAALAERMVELASDPGRRRELGRAGRARASERFAPERQLDAWIAFFRDATTRAL